MIFKSMTPESYGDEEFRSPWGQSPNRPLRTAIKCDTCEGVYFTGDWPWCGGKKGGHKR
jgi:hypothetical protein